MLLYTDLVTNIGQVISLLVPVGLNFFQDTYQSSQIYKSKWPIPSLPAFTPPSSSTMMELTSP
jgi:hypothetical protein